MSYSPPAQTSAHPLADSRVRELTSGVDALYLSGRAELTPDLFEVLDERRAAAEEAGEPVPLPLGDTEWFVESRSFGKYRYRLVNPAGMIGVTPSEHLPSLRVQPWAEFLHGAGAPGTLRYFEHVGELLAGGPVFWSLSRLDLFTDVQGWSVHGDERRRFVCRAKYRDLKELGEEFDGFGFGRRDSGTVSARIYDKTRQIDKKGLDWWPVIWGDRYDPTQPVLRIEAEINRQGLTEYGVDTPDDGLERAAAIWANVTEQWITYRTPTADETRARWPIAPEWEAIQHASLRGEAIGVDRVRALRRTGEIRTLLPALVGYSARLGALLGTTDIDTTLAAAGQLFRADEIRRQVPFADRIAKAAAEEARR